MLNMVLRTPDNWHAHLRQDITLKVIAHFFNIYGRVMCMGNTLPLIETPEHAMIYKENILAEDIFFEPVMCIMLTQDTTPDMIYKAKESGIKFIKFIPVGTSTGAVKGLRLDDFDQLFKIFPVIVETGLHLLIHAELMSYKDGTIIPFKQREEEAIEIIRYYRNKFPLMNITIEHASTERMINFILSEDSSNLCATLTPQHAILTYDQVFDSDNRLIDPFLFCLPVAKDEKDRLAVRAMMVSGDERFFFGADSAFHPIEAKLGADPKPGVFFGPAEFPLIVEIFEEESALDKLEDFTSRFGAEYYGYPMNSGTIILIEETWPLAKFKDGIRYSLGGKIMRWKVIEECGIVAF